MSAESPKGKLETKAWEEGDIVQLTPDKLPSLYANNVSIGFTNWDAWMQFAEIVGEKDGKLLVAPKLRVVMSLEHAKAFVHALRDSLANFEAQFGEIKMFAQKEPATEK